MTKTVEFYYDYGSPTAYLAWTQLPDICAKHGATLIYKPILLGGLFKATGNQSPVTVEAKGKWLFDDITRYAKHYDVPFALNPHFIVNTMPAMRGAMWAEANGVLETYNAAMYRAMWVDAKNIAEPDVITQVLTAAGLDAAAMGEAIQQPEIKQALIASTEAAANRGLFGAPSMIVDDQVHFGQDRLEWVERALAA